MGKLKRERIERILSGSETAISQMNHQDSLRGVSAKVIDKVEDATRKIVEKTLVPKWTGMSLPQQVGVARKMLRVAGLANFRANFLKPSGFPDDIKDKAKAGWTNEQITAYYWECPEWVSFWKYLGLDEANFQTLLPVVVPVPVVPEPLKTVATPSTTVTPTPLVFNTYSNKESVPWYRRLFSWRKSA